MGLGLEIQLLGLFRHRGLLIFSNWAVSNLNKKLDLFIEEKRAQSSSLKSREVEVCDFKHLLRQANHFLNQQKHILSHHKKLFQGIAIDSLGVSIKEVRVPETIEDNDQVENFFFDKLYKLDPLKSVDQLKVLSQIEVKKIRIKFLMESLEIVNNFCGLLGLVFDHYFLRLTDAEIAELFRCIQRKEMNEREFVQILLNEYALIKNETPVIGQENISHNTPISRHFSTSNPL